MDPDIEKMFDHNISHIRSTVIDHAVKIEFLINGILCRVFGLSESASVSFGNTSSALSFIAKVNLLLDLKILLKEDKIKLKSFAEIRNQFAHNFLIVSIKDCPEPILKQLRTWYDPNADIKDIQNFQILYVRLYADVKKAIEKLIDVVKEKAGKKGEELGVVNFNKFLYEEMESYCEQDLDFKNKFLAILEKTGKTYRENPPSDDDIFSLPLI